MKRREKVPAKLARFTREGWRYMLESKIYIYMAIALFFISLLGGFFLAGYLEPFYSMIVKSIFESAGSLSGAQLGFFIFFNNFKSAFLALFLGIFLGIFSIFNVLFNGSLIGYVLKILWGESGFTQFWKLLPHGIFELPALFISWGLGIRMGMFIFSKNPAGEMKRRFEESLKTFFFIVVPLLIIAAIIETLLIAFL